MKTVFYKANSMKSSKLRVTAYPPGGGYAVG